MGSFAVTNFSQDFISSLGPKRGGTVFEIGGLKFDIGYHTMTEFNLSPTSSLEEMAYALVNPDEEHGISSTTQTIINGTEALNVKSWSQFGEGQFYLMKMSDNFIVLFAPNDADHPDILAILNSMTMAPDAIQLPIQHPAGPPEGMAAPCIGQNQLVDGSDEENSFPGTLDCNQVTDAEKLMWTICNVRDSIISRNTQPLPGYMGDTFKIGYWQSEGVDLTKDQAMAELKNNHIPPNTGDMTFTTERTQFPSLFGMPPEQIFPPDANIAEVVYSEGWGQNGQGAALLYFAENSVGDYYFYGMVIAQQHFDK
ncbi:MAG: hypothetical protein GWN30_13230 [Gammaproteobacteria bacterium]|nr:hypothetical protein [Gammaproteobacteria bacterium]